jgi:hypothetical protein
MGLDNYPHTYPCRAQGTAIMTTEDEPRIDCDATIKADRCPWKVAAEGRGQPVTSMMFGTPCWYRGKVGTWMLGTLEEAGHPLPRSIAEGFYGDPEPEEGQPNLSPAYCAELSTFMEDHIEAYAAQVSKDPDVDLRDAIEHYRYAAWWMRFASEQCEGAEAWW